MSDEDVMLPLRAGLLGFPVAHSLSPVMHNAAYEALGLPWHYELCPCQTHDDAAVFLAGAESDGFLGLNVTMPYKKLALSAASVPDRMAELAGGANVLTFCDGECFCANTDGAGIVAALEGEGGLEVSGGTFLVCGTGPTAGAAASALVLGGASLVFVMSRKAASARAFTAAVGLDRLVPVTYGEAADVLPRVSGVVDATPVGMKAGDVSPLPGNLFTSSHVVLDMVYGHGETNIMAKARAADARALDGLSVLVEQAALTVEIWAEVHAGRSVKAPRGLMRAAAEDEMARRASL